MRWKCLHERELALPPGQVGRDQLADIGIYGEVARRVDAGDDAGEHADDDDRPRMACANPDNLRKLGSQHGSISPGRAG
jgi:hypothetical protein